MGHNGHVVCGLFAFSASLVQAIFVQAIQVARGSASRPNLQLAIARIAPSVPSINVNSLDHGYSDNGERQMYDIRQFTLSSMTECGAALRKLGSSAQSMEEAANEVVRYLYDHLIDGETGERAMALVRFFKTHPYEDLDQPLREAADSVLGDVPLSPDTKCLTLLASVGEEPEWNSRAGSAGHKAIPLPSEELVRQFPMISNLVKQFGLEITSVLDPDPSCLRDMEKTTYNVFLVPETPGSPYVPAQKEFVVPYGIKSTLGFGGMLPSGNLFAVIMFSKAPILQDTADMFKPLALAVKVALLPFEQAVFCRCRETCNP